MPSSQNKAGQGPHNADIAINKLIRTTKQQLVPHLSRKLALMAQSTAQPVVLVTGSSVGGLGGDLATFFHSQNCWVFATARSSSKTAELRALGITTLEMDVT